LGKKIDPDKTIKNPPSKLDIDKIRPENKIIAEKVETK
jgi:hypothetical protein